MADHGNGSSRHRAQILACGCTYHFYHDGIADGLYAFLPLWQLAFDLSLTQVGLIIAGFEGAMAAFQVPAGLLSERFGERRLLAAGTFVTAAAFMAVGLAGGFFPLMAFLLLSGFASGVQHPLSSSMVSRAYLGGPRRAVLGTFNFSGDLGKMAFPAIAGLALTVMSWRMLGVVFGIIGILVCLVVGFVLIKIDAGGPPVKEAATAEKARVQGWGIEERLGFSVLSAISILDTAVRSGLFTLLPFF